jgi:pyruvate/2-oxoglutarate dehydrogenase complex dihydrolipoamide dehydrogenase (E3) component
LVATVAAGRGHEVTLHEQAELLGGQLLLARRLSGKGKIAWLLEDLERDLARSGATVHLGSTVTADVLRAAAPDALVFATGATAFMPNIPGIADSRVASAWDIIATNEATTNGRMVVVGGDSTGCELALDLARAGALVQIIEQRDEVAVDMEPIARGALRKHLSSHPGICVRLGWRAIDVVEEGVVAVGAGGRRETFGADRIVLATGVAPVRNLISLTKDLESQSQVYAIGDCVRPGNIATALADARAVGCLI